MMMIDMLPNFQLDLDPKFVRIFLISRHFFSLTSASLSLSRVFRVYKFWAPLSSKKVSFTDYNETNLKINYEITDCGALFLFLNINKFFLQLVIDLLSHFMMFWLLFKNILIENALN